MTTAMKSRKLLSLTLLPLFLLSFLVTAPSFAASNSNTCSTVTIKSHPHPGLNGTMWVQVQKTTRCPDHVDDTYQNIGTVTYLEVFGGCPSLNCNKELFAWGIQEQYTVDVTTSQITQAQNPPTVSWYQCCLEGALHPAFTQSPNSLYTQSIDPQEIHAHGSATISYCYIVDPEDGGCLYFYYTTVTCDMYAYLTAPSGSCSD